MYIVDIQVQLIHDHFLINDDPYDYCVFFGVNQSSGEVELHRHMGINLESVLFLITSVDQLFDALTKII